MSTDKIPGGLAKGMSLADIAKYHKLPLKSLETKLKQGIKTEMEHTIDKAVAREIAMDHIYEDPNYYSKLKKIETEGTCGYNQDVETGEIFDTPGGLGEGDKRGLDMYALELQKGLEEAILDGLLNEKDPKTGTGKKPKGSSRRLYTDEDPSDTVGIKFSTKQDIIDTLSKASFKSKSHARQSQIINLIHQRVRAAYERAKDPDVKRRLKTALDYAEQRKEASKNKTERLRKLKENINNKYNLAGNCTTGLDDPYFQRYVCDDATEMAGIVDEDSNEFLTSEEFIKKVNWDENILGIATDNMFEFAYNEYKDIYWAYNIEDDVHFFFIKDRIYENYKDYIKVNKLNKPKQVKEIGDASAQIFDYDKNQIKTILDQIIQEKTRNNKLIFNSSQGQYEVYITVVDIINIGYDILNKLIYNQYAPGTEYKENFDLKTLNFLNTIKIQNSKVYPKDYNFLLLRAHEYFKYFKEKGILNEIPYKLSIRIDFSFNESNDNTNLNEQYKVLSTVTDIIKEFLKEINKHPYIDAEIIFEVKADEDNVDTDSNSKRGKFYEKYIEKNISNLPGDWEYTKNNDGFILTNSDKEKEFEETLKKAFSTTLNETKGSAVPYGSGYKKYIPEITKFMVDKGMNIKPLPVVRFIEDDEKNAQDVLGRTAFYNQNDKSISLYTLGRHPKDILRSFCHEMIHHMQNVEGRLPKFYTTNTQEDSTLNDIEEEAHKLGSMTMREFEDTIKK